MFYSVSILSKKNGNLGYIWIAANFDSTSRMGLTRREINRVDVLQSCQDIIKPNAPLALRLSALLMWTPKMRGKGSNARFRRAQLTAIDLTAPVAARKDALTLPDPLEQDASYLALMLPWNMQNQLPSPPHDSQYFSVHEDTSYDKDAQQPSPFVANPKDISLHEEHTTPIETLQKQVERREVETGFGDESLIFMDEVPVASEAPVPATLAAEAFGPTMEDAVILFDETADCFKPVVCHNAEATPMNPILHTPPQNRPQDDAFCTPLIGQQLMDGGEGLQMQQATPKRNRKPRRKLVFDEDIRMPRDKLRQNLMSGDSTCLQVNLSAMKMTPAKVLLAQPTCIASIKNSVFVSLWERCAVKVTEPNQMAKGRGVVDMQASPPTFGKIPNTDAAHLPHNPSESVGSEVEALRGSLHGEHSYHEQSAHSIALTSSDTSENQSYDHMDSSSAHRTDSTKPGRVPPPNVAGLSPIMDTDQELDPMSMHVDFDCDLSGSFNANTSTTVGTEINSFLSHVTKTIGVRSEFEFQDLLPNNCSRKIASRMFSQTLELISRRVLESRQRDPYGPIVLSRAEAF
eukprot:Em0013g361a